MYKFDEVTFLTDKEAEEWAYAMDVDPIDPDEEYILATNYIHSPYPNFMSYTDYCTLVESGLWDIGIVNASAINQIRSLRCFHK